MLIEVTSRKISNKNNKINRRRKRRKVKKRRSIVTVKRVILNLPLNNRKKEKELTQAYPAGYLKNNLFLFRTPIA